jgi:hypothetical protein
MSRQRRPGAFTDHVLHHHLWGDGSFFVLDVGCSGGIEARWQAFGSRLRAVGFDPLVAEIDRLSAENAHSGTVYEAAFVGCRDFDSMFPAGLRADRIKSRNDEPFPRVSAAAAQSRLQTSYIQETFNAGAPVSLSNRFTTLDDYVAPDDYPEVDFAKIDTDGHDIEVILGAERLMAAGGLLGVMVEAQFHGATHEFANTFSNIDRILRRRGFTLFDLTTNRYSRACLPAPFVWDLAAQTTTGQVLWGDAAYFRDLASPEYDRMWPGYAVTDERVMKLACLYDLFDLPDCAAELLINRGQFLEAGHRQSLLDALASGEPGSYAALVAAFEADFTSFYRSRRSRPDSPTEPAGHGEELGPSTAEASSKTERRLRARLAYLAEKNALLNERLKTKSAKIANLRNKLGRLDGHPEK